MKINKTKRSETHPISISSGQSDHVRPDLIRVCNGSLIGGRVEQWAVLVPEHSNGKCTPGLQVLIEAVIGSKLGLKD